MNLPKGKGVYIWQHRNILGGNPVAIADKLSEAEVSFVAIKLHDGISMWTGLENVIEKIRANGIAVGGGGDV